MAPHKRNLQNAKKHFSVYDNSRISTTTYEIPKTAILKPDV